MFIIFLSHSGMCTLSAPISLRLKKATPAPAAPVVPTSLNDTSLNEVDRESALDQWLPSPKKWRLSRHKLAGPGVTQKNPAKAPPQLSQHELDLEAKVMNERPGTIKFFTAN